MDQGTDGHSQAQSIEGQIVIANSGTRSVVQMIDAGQAQPSARHTGTAGQAYRNCSDIVEFVRQVFSAALQDLELCSRGERTLREHGEQFDNWYAGLRRQDGTSQVDYYDATARRDLTAVLGNIVVSLRNIDQHPQGPGLALVDVSHHIETLLRHFSSARIQILPQPWQWSPGRNNHYRPFFDYASGTWQTEWAPLQPRNVTQTRSLTPRPSGRRSRSERITPSRPHPSYSSRSARSYQSERRHGEYSDTVTQSSESSESELEEESDDDRRDHSQSTTQRLATVVRVAGAAVGAAGLLAYAAHQHRRNRRRARQ